MLKKILLTLGMSMLPVVELRGGIPFGLSQGLPLWLSVSVSIAGNVITVPFIILFIRKLFRFLTEKLNFMQRIVDRLEKRAMSKAELVHKYELFGLCLLVAIPLPGTGAWTGSLVAALLDIRLKRAFPAIFLGVVIAAVITSVISYGVFRVL